MTGRSARQRLLAVFLLAVNLSGADTPRTVVMDFGRAEAPGSMEPGLADFSRAVQAELLVDANQVWIERQEFDRITQEVDLAGVGGSDPSTAIRLGNWMRADLMLRGEITTRENRGELILEAIGLKRAELLATRKTHVTLRPGGRLAPTAAEIKAAVAAALETLAEGRAALERVAGLRVIAPLYFRNISRSDRLDFAEERLAASLAAAATPSQGFHALQFPRTDAAKGEAGLVLGGLTDTDPDAWQRVADAYVWGTIEEKGEAGEVFEAVPVTITLQVWNGFGPSQETRWDGLVRELDEGMLSVVTRALQGLQPVPAGAPRSSTERDRIAAGLLSQVHEMAVRIQGSQFRRGAVASGVSSEDFARSEAGQRLVAYRQQLLEIARFFKPLDPQVQNLFGWDYKFRWSKVLGRGTISGSWRVLAENEEQLRQTIKRGNKDEIESATEQVNNCVDAIREAAYALAPVWYQGGPALTQDEIRDQRQKAVALCCDRLMANKRETVPPGKLVRFGNRQVSQFLSLVQDAEILEARPLVERLWPALRKELGRVLHTETKETNIGDSFSLKVVSTVLGAYDAFGDTDRAITLLDEAWAAYVPAPVVQPVKGTAAPAPVPQKPWKSAPAAAPAPATLQAEIREIEPWRKVVYVPDPSAPTHPLKKRTRRLVDEMAWHQGRLWIAESPQIKVHPEFGLKNPEGDHFLWAYDPVLRRAELATDYLASHTTIRTMISQGENLWLGFDGAGVWRWNTAEAGSDIRRFKGEDGLVTTRIQQAQVAGGTLYFLGGDSQKAMVAVWDAATGKWVGLDVRGFAGSLFQQRTMAVCGEWLGFADGEAIFYHTATKEWKRLVHRPVIPPGVVVREVPRFDVSVISADESGFWLGRENTLRFMDPRAPEGQKDLSLPGLPVAAAHEGPWLWLLLEDRLLSAQQEDSLRYTRTEQGGKNEERPTRLALVDKRTFTCVGVLALPTVRMRKLVVADGRVWVGGSAILEVIPVRPGEVAAAPVTAARKDFPLHRAAWAGDLPAVDARLAAKDDVNQAAPGGGTPLMAAVDAGHTGIVRRLLAQGADPNLVTEDGDSALLLAVERGHGVLVDMLLAAGARPEPVDYAPLRRIEQHHVQVVSPPPAVRTKEAPRQPPSLQARVLKNGDVRLTWEDRAATENIYEIQRFMDNRPWGKAITVQSDTTEWIDHLAYSIDPMGPKPTGGVKELTYRVSAKNAAYVEDLANAPTVRVTVNLPTAADPEPPHWLSWGERLESPANAEFRTPLMAASVRGDLPTMRALLERGAEVNFQDNAGRTALQLAIRHGRTTAARELLARGANAVLADYTGETPVMAAYLRHDDEALLRDLLGAVKGETRRRAASQLVFEAARTGQLADLELLRSLGGDFNALLWGGESVLSSALLSKQPAVAAWLLGQGVDLASSIQDQGERNRILGEIVSALLWTEDVASLEKILDNGLDINSVIGGQTLIGMAVEKDKLGFAGMLKKRGADLDKPSSWGKRPVEYAKSDAMRRLLTGQGFARWSWPVETFYRRGVEMTDGRIWDGGQLKNNDATGASAQLLLACEQGDLNAAQQALAEGAIPDCRNKPGMTPLCFAARRGDLPLVQWLVENGASVNYPTKAANFPLGFAAEAGRTAVIDFLIAAGANVNAHGQGSTALMAAVFGRQPATVRQLLAAGADINLCGGGTRSRNRQSPLAVALQQGNAPMVEFLVAQGANTRARFDLLHRMDGNADPRRQMPTLLMFAAEGGNVELIRQSISWGQDPKYQTNDGYDALAWAASAGRKEAVEFLLPLSEKEGRALQSARRNNQLEITTMLERAGYQ